MRITQIAAISVAGGLTLLAGVGPAVANPKPLPVPRETMTAAPPKPPAPAPTVTVTVPPYVFKATIAPNPFRAGNRLTIRTGRCPTTPDVNDVNELFVDLVVLKPVVSKKTGVIAYIGSGVTRSDPVEGKTYRIVVTCEDFDPVTFATHVRKKVVKQTEQTKVVPRGGVQTGDGGSLRQHGPLPLVVGGAALALGGAGLGLVVLRRRAPQQDA